MKNGIVQYSSTGWEVSNFGGHLSLIYDHPFVAVDWEVNYEIKDRMSLPYSLSNKLLNIFLLKIKEHNLVVYLKSYVMVRENVTPFGKTHEAVVTPYGMSVVLNEVIKLENEYRSLFEFYENTISSTEITFPIGSDKENNSTGEEEKEGNGEKKGKNENKGEGPGAGGKKKPGKEDESTGKKGKKEESKGELKKAASKISSLVKEAIEKLEEYVEGIEKETNRIPTPKLIATGNGGGLTPEFIYPGPHGRWKPNITQIRNSMRLVQMLDINFDPYSDRLNSLRNGKLDSRKVAEVIPGNMNVYYKVEPNISTKPFSVCILCDESGSMYGKKMDMTVELVKILYLAFSEILPKDKLFIYGHTGSYSPVIRVYKDKYNDNFETVIGNMQSRSSNYDGPVIEAIYEKLRGISDDNIIFIILSDGQPSGSHYGGPDDIKKMKKIVEKCRRDGIVTIGIGIQYFTHKIYDYSCVIKELEKEMLLKTSHIINKTVKTEFQ